MFFNVLFLEVGLDAIFTANVLEAFPQALHVWYDYVLFGIVSFVGVTAAVVLGVVMLEIL